MPWKTCPVCKSEHFIFSCVEDYPVEDRVVCGYCSQKERESIFERLRAALKEMHDKERGII